MPPAAARKSEPMCRILLTGGNNREVYSGVISVEVALFLAGQAGKSLMEILKPMGEQLADKRRM